MINTWSFVCIRCVNLSLGLGSSRRMRVLERIATCSVGENVNKARRSLSSKTPSKLSIKSTPAAPVAQTLPHFSGYDVRQLDPSIRAKLQTARTEMVNAQASSLVHRSKRKKKEILRMDESEYEGTAVLKKKMPLLDRRGEAQSFFLRALEPDKQNNVDMLAFFQADIDLRPEAVKRWWTTLDTEVQIKNQEYNPKRNQILGNDLAAAHFIVFRHGKVRFMGNVDWITTYRTDAKPGVSEDDLPVMAFNLCTLPVNYDPKYRLEAIDGEGLPLYYEGLGNFENLHYLKWLSLRNAPYINDWCIDRIARMFCEKLEYIDLSGCKQVTDKGIGSLHRCRRLKVLKVENMQHLENLEIVCAMLEDHIPHLEVIGVDYQRSAEQLQLDGAEMERKAKENKDALEKDTITIEPKNGPGPGL